MSQLTHAKLTRAKTWQLLSHLESNPQDKQVVTAIVHARLEKNVQKAKYVRAEWNLATLRAVKAA
jgi:hypothetical protein|tara:strand:+ start:798 stop:992 length:195 start_codon:yes stop_codon:yes gene_type:complete